MAGGTVELRNSGSQCKQRAPVAVDGGTVESRNGGSQCIQRAQAFKKYPGVIKTCQSCLLWFPSCHDKHMSFEIVHELLREDKLDVNFPPCNTGNMALIMATGGPIAGMHNIDYALLQAMPFWASAIA